MDTNLHADALQADVAAIGRIEAVPTMLELVCRTTGMGFAAIARVTEDRWVACAVRDGIQFGLLPGGELKVETTFCDAVRDGREPVAIDHVAADDDWCGHPTPAMYGFQSYVSVPIVRPDGRFFGTLCAIDPKPARVRTPEILDLFRLLAQLVAFHLDAEERLAAGEANLVQEHRNTELREQFIAVLGHDLRNPLAAVDAGARMLARRHPDAEAVPIIEAIQGSVRRMAELIGHVLDFARARLGDGLAIERDGYEPLAPVLRSVAAELRAAWPDRRIEEDIAIAGPVACDRARIGQLLSNLLANALAHGTPGTPVRVRATVHGGIFELDVANAGEPIPPAVMERLFQPYFRGGMAQRQQGLGLGLFIAAAIAKAHGGSLGAESTPEETCFRFRMPTDTPA